MYAINPNFKHKFYQMPVATFTKEVNPRLAKRPLFSMGA